MTAINLLADHNDPTKEWPWPHPGERRVTRMAPIYRKAGLALDDQKLLKLSTSHDFSRYTVKDNLGEIWAQRDIQLLYPLR